MISDVLVARNDIDWVMQGLELQQVDWSNTKLLPEFNINKSRVSFVSEKFSLVASSFMRLKVSFHFFQLEISVHIFYFSVYMNFDL